MAQAPTPEAWFIGFGTRLRRIHAERPELPPKSPGRGDSILALAMREVTQQERLRLNTIRSRWDAMLASWPQHVPDFMTEPRPGGPGEAPKEPPTLAERVEIGRHRKTAQEASSALREALAKIAALEDELSAFRTLTSVNPEPAPWTLSPRRGEKSEHVPYLFTSDFQVGEVIREQETEAGYGYDVATFRRRYRYMIERTIDLALNHGGAWSFPGIVYARGGDTISGAIHDELADTDEVTPIEAVKIAFEEEAAGILKLAEAFGRVEVKEAGGGNHDRSTKKPRSKRAVAYSYDSLVSYMLRREFAKDPRISIQGTESPDVYFRIYGTPILLTHGDKIGSRGGQGFIGAEATILRGAQKVILEQQRLGRPVEQVHVGHYHIAREMGIALSNGSLPGFSEYAKLLRARPELPCQWLVFYSPKWGAVDWKKVYLEEPRLRRAA